MKYYHILLSILLTAPAFAQTKLPIIKATNKKIIIRDGAHLRKNSWTLEPNLRPDTYTAYRTRQAQWVTFITDVDSIRTRVTPGSHFDFVILLNGKDSCFTRIESAIPPESKTMAATHDTIPFTLTAYNAIAVKAVINGTDSLNLDFDLSSFDFHITREGILKKTKLLSNQPDALAGKVAPNYNKLSKVSSLKMGSANWTDPAVSSTYITSYEMDGRFGWNVFEGKQVEINYTRHLLIVTSQLPKIPKGYVRAAMSFGRSFPYLIGSFEIDGKTYTGNFAMDTGSEQAIILDSAWVANSHFPQSLKVLKTNVIHDPTGAQFTTKTVLAPQYRLNGFAINNIPTIMLGTKHPGDAEMNFLGNDLLKRFNIIIDFKHDYIYLKPNGLMEVGFRGGA